MATGNSGSNTNVLERGEAPDPRDAQLIEYEKFIDQQIRKIRSQVKTVDVLAALGTLVCGLLVFLLAAALVDHWLVAGGLGFAGRLVLFLAMLAGSGYYLVRHVVPLVIRRINPVYAAFTIERGSPSLKNSLLSFVLFRGDRKSVPQPVYDAIEEQAATRLAGVSLDSSVDRSSLVRLGYVLLAVVVLSALYKVASPKDPWQTAGRVVMPWADLAAPSRVTIEAIEPGDTAAARGTQLTVSAEIRGLRDDDAVQVVYSTADGQVVDRAIPMHVPQGDYRYRCQLPESESGLQQRLNYRIVAGDALSPLHSVRVTTALTIEVRNLHYDYPTYTGFSDRDAANQGDIKALEGTRITVEAMANLPIESAYIDLGADGRNDVKMQLQERRARGSFMLRLASDGRTPQYDSYQLRLRTGDGQTNREPVLYRIDVTPDLAPEIEVLNPQPDEVQVPLGSTAEIELQAIDPDFALAHVGLLAEVDGRQVLDESLLPEPRPGQFNVRHQIDTAKLGLKVDDVVTYWGVARDNKQPEANEASTGQKRLRIVEPRAPQENEQQQEQQEQDQQPGQERQDQEAQPDQQQQEGQQQVEPQQEGQQQPEQQQEGPRQEGEQQEGGEQQSQDGNAGGEQGEADGQAQPQQGGGEGGPQDSQPGQQQGQPGANPGEGEGASEGVPSDGSDDGSAFEKILRRMQEDRQGENQPGEGQQQPGAEQAQQDQQRPDGQQPPEQQPKAQPQDRQGEGGAADSPQNDGQGERQQQPRGAGGEGQREQRAPGQDAQGPDAQRPGAQQPAADGQRQQPGANNDAQSAEQRDQAAGDRQPQGEPAGDAAQPDAADPAREQPGQSQPGADPQPREGQGASTGDSTRNGQQPQGEPQSPDGGPQDPQGRNQQTQESPAGGQGANDSPSADPQNPLSPRQRPPGDSTQPPAEGGPQQAARDRSESDSQGQDSGDRSGDGQQGGGQQANREGTGTAGQNTPSDEGAGAAEQQGSGENSDRPGADAAADRQTGQPSEGQRGAGSSQRPGDEQAGRRQPGEGQNGQGDQPGQPGDAPPQDADRQGGEGTASGTPTGGGQPGQFEARDSRQGGEPGGDEANLDYAREATDLALTRLKDQLDRQQVDQELLDELGWSQDDLAKFVERWESLKGAARSPGDQGAEARQELDEALRSLGLRQDRVTRRGGGPSDEMRDVSDTGRSDAPSQYLQRMRSYLRGISRDRTQSE